MALQCCGDGGRIAAKRTKLSSSATGEDRLSALPEDLLIDILLGLGTTAEAARTSALSSYWRHLWVRLPELCFPLVSYGHRIREVLVAEEALPLLRHIFVTAEDSAPDSLQTWLPDAARRLSGDLIYRNMLPEKRLAEGEAGEGGAVQLPCFEIATGIELNLGFLGLALPLAGLFTRLTKLGLYRVQLHGPCELGDVVSSPRCPSLQKLHVIHARGLDRLTIHSESLLQVVLEFLSGLQQLSIVAPVLEKLELLRCLANNQPVVNISTPQLVTLKWMDAYDPSSVQLGNLRQLCRLSTTFFLVYGIPDHRHNRDFQRLLQQFPFIRSLKIMLCYLPDTVDIPYLMEEITMLPRTASLTISIINKGHVFGPSLFHVLGLCTGIKRLKLTLRICRDLVYACQSGCNCGEPTNWKTEGLLLNCLKDVEICNLEGAEHEVVFMKRLFSWAPVLEKMRITFDSSVSKRKAKRKARKLFPILSSFARPTAVELYMYDESGEEVLLEPEDQGAAL